MPTSRASTPNVTLLLWLVVLATSILAYLVPLAIPIPLLDPDEGLHASIAQEMVERGDYVTPRLAGEPFFDKPIFYFWLQALALRTFGMTEAAVRLPGELLGLCGALTTAWLARKLLEPPGAALAGLIYLTMAAPLALAQAAVHDVALVPLTNLALVALLAADARASLRQAWPLYLAAGVVLGIAILTKGLVGIALVGLAFGAFLVSERRVSLRAVVGAGIVCLVAVLVAAPWYLAMHAEHADYLRYYVIDRHVRGFATATQRHGGRAWWYYLPVLVGGGMPWIVYVPTTVWFCWNARRDPVAPAAGITARTCRFLGAWVVADVLFLSAASSKLWTYCLPVFPALAILAALTWAAFLRAPPPVEPRWWRRILLLAWPVACGALPLATRIVSRQHSLENTLVTRWVIILTGLSLLVPWYLFVRRRYPAALVTIAGSVVLHLLCILQLIVPRVAEHVSAQRLADYFNERGAVPQRLVVVDERIGSLYFYLRPELRSAVAPGQFAVVYVEQLDTVLPAAHGLTIACPERTWRRLPADSPLRTLPSHTVGHYRVYDMGGDGSDEQQGAGETQSR